MKVNVSFPAKTCRPLPLPLPHQLHRHRRQRLGRGRDHRRRVGRPEGRMQARQGPAFLLRRVIFGLRDAADPDDQALDALFLAPQAAHIPAAPPRPPLPAPYPSPFPISFIVIAVSASVAVEITAGASGAQKGECRLGKVRPSFFAASYSACGTPPTQTIRLLMLLSSRPKRPKSSPPITGGIFTTRSSPKLVFRNAAISSVNSDRKSVV